MWIIRGLVTNLDDFDIGQAVQEGLQVDAVQYNAVVKDVAVGLEVNDSLFLMEQNKSNV